jgi:MYXO-CTERM domain-containing protein
MSIARRARALAAPFAVASLALSLAPIGTGCSSATEPSVGEGVVAQAKAGIIGGTTDNADTFVVGININNSAICSGTLIAPNLVLTARHCVSDTTQTVDCTPTGYYTPKITRDNTNAGRYQITTSQNLYGGTSAQKWNVSAVYVLDDQSCPNAANPDCGLCGADLAMLEITKNATGFPAVTLAKPAFAPPVVGETHTAIGYGCQQPEPTCGTLGYRMTIDTQVTGVANYDIETNGHIAGGDSGGPYFDRATATVFGALSRGPQDTSSGLYTRVDVHLDWIVAKAKLAATHGGYTAPSWVNDPIPAKPPAPLALGETCTANGQCIAYDPALAPGVCHRFSSTVAERRCSQMCDATAAGKCPSTFDCVSGYCWPHSDNPPPTPDAGPPPVVDTGVPDTDPGPVDDTGVDPDAGDPNAVPTIKSSSGCSMEAPSDRPPKPIPWIVGVAALAVGLAARRRR